MPEKKPPTRSSLFLILIAVGVLLIGAGLIPVLIHAQETALESSVVVRQPEIMNQAMPLLALIDLQGKPVSLADEAPGKVVLVNNWATWCPPCRDEMPELQAYYQAHAGRGFSVIAIESGEPAEPVINFVRQFGLTFPVWLDPNGTALDSFKNWNLPSSYVVNPQGTILMSWTGPINRATLEMYVTPLLEK
jgi:thiol-disulfide isomerase/thioredoxin